MHMPPVRKSILCKGNSPGASRFFIREEVCSFWLGERGSVEIGVKLLCNQQSVNIIGLGFLDLFEEQVEGHPWSTLDQRACFILSIWRDTWTIFTQIVGKKA